MVFVSSLVLVLAIGGVGVGGSRILSVIPFPMKSHDIVFKPLLMRLAERGHHVTAITAFPTHTHTNITNYREIVFQTKGVDFLKRFDYYEAKRGWTLWTVGWTELFGFWQLMDGVVEDIFTDDQVIGLLEGGRGFDVVICEGLFGSEAVLAVGELFAAPTVVVATFGATLYMNQYMGNPWATAYHPNFLLPYTDRMTFVQRLHNLLVNTFIVVANRVVHVPRHQQLIATHLAAAFASRSRQTPIPALDQLAAHVSLVLLNTHPALGYARPNLPHFVDVGGLHIQPLTNHTIDHNLQKEMDSATEGIIYFSLGSNVNIKDMPTNYKQAFVDAFSKLPHKVFWKSDYEIPHVLMKNVLVRKWFPQQQILAHNNCVGFITHGGLLSLEEAAYYAVPVVGIPFFGDQMMNVKLACDRQFAVHLEYDNITATSVSWAIHQITRNPLYKANARKVSAIFKDGYGTPLERAVYWTEYVIRHEGADHLKSAARLLPWFKLIMLDVLLAILVAILILLLALYLIIRKLTRLALTRQTAKSKSKKNN